MKISNLNVAARLAMGFVTILVLLVLIGLLSLDRMRLMHTESMLTLEDRYPKITAITDIKNNLNQIARSMRNTLLLDDQSQIRAELAQIERDKQVIAERLASLEKQIANPKGRALLAAVQRSRNSYYPYQEAFLRHVQAGELDQAKTLLLATLHQKQQLYFGTLDQLAAFQAGLMKEAGAAVAAAYFSSVSLLASLATLSIMLAGLIAWRIARSITVPLHLAVRMAQTVAAGDLTNEVVATGKDETGRLLHALMAMNSSLQTIVGEVRSGTDTIATASGQIASGNLDLSARTEQQASSLEQTASAMEELTGTVKQNADNARQANQLAGSARDVAVRGGQVVAQVVDTMRAINASSKKIADIVGVIDSIAFQTNILALNAAVEAARAGEQGRGFAVVATEVRNLAHRSAAAAKEIKGLIDASVGSVDAGTRLVGEAGATMQEIVDSVNRVTDVMSEITAASQEQTSGIEQINQAIAQMDEVTQQNAALVDEAAAAAGALQDQAGTLLQVVSVFKLHPGHAPLARRPSLMVAAQ